MTFLGPQNAYLKTQQREESELGDAHSLITITLSELQRSLAVLNQPEKPLPGARSKHLTRCFTAIYILQDSLDFDRGGDIALNLFRVYEYCRLQLLAYNRGEDDASIDTAYNAITDILDAWKAIA